MSDSYDRIPFSILSATSFEEDSPPEELLVQNHSPLARGWRSERFCIYPQTIVIRLAPGNCRVRKVQILSHHFMISSRLEFFIGRIVQSLGDHAPAIQNDSSGNDRDDHRETDSAKKIEYTRLGYVSLSDNSKSDYKARELKSIHIDAEGDHVKLVLHKNFINTLNLYNQVGIVALNVMGTIQDSDYFISTNDEIKKLIGLDPLVEYPDWQPTHDNSNAAFWGAMNQRTATDGAPAIRDLAFSVYHDEDLATFVANVLVAKDKAVRGETKNLETLSLTYPKEEEYGLAKSIKILYQLSKKAGDEIARLQVQKAKAVEIEDYETAEEIKADISDIKRALHLKVNELGLAIVDNGQIVPLKKAYHDDDLRRPSSRRNDLPLDASQFDILHPSDIATSATEPALEPTLYVVSQQSKARVIPPPASAVADNSTSTSSLANVSTTAVSLDKPNTVLPDPERLTEEQEDEMKKLIRVFGSFVARCLISRQFKLREWALEEVGRRLESWGKRKRRQAERGRGYVRSQRLPQSGKKSVNWGRSREKSNDTNKGHRSKSPALDGSDENLGETSEEPDMIRISWTELVKSETIDDDAFIGATFDVIKRGIDDSREKVTVSASALWDQLIRHCSLCGISPSLVFKYLEEMFPSLLLKATDLNPRVKQICIELIATIESAYHVVPHSTIPFLANPIVSKTLKAQSRYVKGRLECLRDTIKLFGVDDDAELQNREKSGLTSLSVMNFTEPHLQNKSAEVREAAVGVVVELVLQVGDDSVARHLTNVKPQLIALIKDRVAIAQGVAVKPRARKRHATPWKENVLSDHHSRDEAVMKLKEEVEALRDIIDGSSSATVNVEPSNPAPVSKSALLKAASKQEKLATSPRRPIPFYQDNATPFDDPIPEFPTGQPVVPPRPQEQQKKSTRVKIHLEDSEDPDTNWLLDKTCIFCDKKSEEFSAENLDIHYWKDCPALCNCPLCNLIVEIQALTAHMIAECDGQSLVRRCPRCNEAIMTSEYLSHSARQTCKVAPTAPGVSRCPLCHLDVPGGNLGFKKHLLYRCPLNARIA